jgi:hypothetical protein
MTHGLERGLLDPGEQVNLFSLPPLSPWDKLFGGSPVRNGRVEWLRMYSETFCDALRHSLQTDPTKDSCASGASKVQQANLIPSPKEAAGESDRPAH